MDYNNLRGTIPSSLFSHVTRLKELNLEKNDLDGNIPSSVASLRDVSTYLQNLCRSFFVML